MLMLVFCGNISWLRYFLFSTGISLFLLLISIPVSAQGNSAIAQQFQAKDADVTIASLVNIAKDNPNYVILSDAEHVDQLIGVVSSKPLIELSEEGGRVGVQVVSNGTTLTLVSDLNGKITTGDKITASPIAGVGMKAIESTVVVGTAQASLDSVELETREVTDKVGKKQYVKIGLIPVQVGVAFYSPHAQKQSAFVPPFLQTLANQVTGKDVSPIRVLIAALVLLLLFISVTVLLYSSVRSSIISIGRNPLSESAVRKSLFQVGITVFAVLIFAAAIVYLVLTT